MTGEAGHCTQHDLGAVDLLDVLVGNQLDDFLVDFQVLIRFFARSRLAEEPAEDRKDHDRGREPQDETAGTWSHKVPGASCCVLGAQARNGDIDAEAPSTQHRHLTVF